ncbi:hypothetical protein ACP275_08G111700 [Erythranthe tilingii]
MGHDKLQLISLLIIVLCFFVSDNIFQVSAARITIEPRSPFAVENGQFAVGKHNQMERTSLIFLNVENGFIRHDKGKTYIHLTIKVSDRNSVYKYNTRICDDPNAKIKKRLLRFEKA